MIGVIKFDYSDFLRKADELSAAADQVPFALARALNEAAADAQNVLILSTWPQHVTMRNTSFMRAALRRTFATKSNLTATIYDQLHRGSLAMHARGGTKTAKGRLAIPNQADIKIGAHGVRKQDRPAALIARTSRRALRITRRGIFVGQGGRLHLKYTLRSAARISADVPFYDDFKQAMLDGVRTSFPNFLKQAMKTRRR